MKAQRERLESLLNTFPGAIETSALRALSLRLNHVEKLVSRLIKEEDVKSASTGTRRQYIISLIALGITVILWGLFIILDFLR